MPVRHNHISQVRRIAVVGTGLLGGSIGLGLKASGYTGAIVGVGRRQETLDRALAKGCITEGSTSLAKAVKDSELIVLATPLGAFEATLKELATADIRGGGAVLTDVGSTKRVVCDLARAMLPEPSYRLFVGSHPMAGSERHGPDHAEARLFANRPCILTPDDATDADAIALVESFWQMLGMKPLRMTPDEHDDKVAAISHLPHAVAVLLVELAEAFDGLGVASTGFADTTRVASGDPAVWQGIFHTNQRAMLHTIDAFADRLAAFRKLIETDDVDGMLALLKSAKQTRDGWRKPAGDCGDKTSKEKH
jgi:prephenate dehydrogenase